MGRGEECEGVEGEKRKEEQISANEERREKKGNVAESRGKNMNEGRERTSALETMPC